MLRPEVLANRCSTAPGGPSGATGLLPFSFLETPSHARVGHGFCITLCWAGLAGRLRMGCGKSNKAIAIEKVIEQDRDNRSAESRPAWASSTSTGIPHPPSQNTSLHCGRSIHACPSDFQAAYLKHIHAWDSLKIGVEHNNGLNAFLKGFFAVGQSLPADIARQEADVRQLSDSWHESRATGSALCASLAETPPVTPQC